MKQAFNKDGTVWVCDHSRVYREKAPGGPRRGAPARERRPNTPARRRDRGRGSEHGRAGSRAPDHPPTQSTPVRSRAHGSQGRHEQGLRSRNSMNVLCPRVRLVSDRTERKESHFHLHIKLARSADMTPTFSHFTKSSNAFLADRYAESVPQPPARGPGRAWIT